MCAKETGQYYRSSQVKSGRGSDQNGEGRQTLVCTRPGRKKDTSPALLGRDADRCRGKGGDNKGRGSSRGRGAYVVSCVYNVPVLVHCT